MEVGSWKGLAGSGVWVFGDDDDDARSVDGERTNECMTPSHAGRRVGGDHDGEGRGKGAAGVTGDRTREKSRR